MNRRTVWVCTSYGYSVFLPATTVGGPHLEIRLFGFMRAYRCRAPDVTVTLTVSDNSVPIRYPHCSHGTSCWASIFLPSRVLARATSRQALTPSGGVEKGTNPTASRLGSRISTAIETPLSRFCTRCSVSLRQPPGLWLNDNLKVRMVRTEIHFGPQILEPRRGWSPKLFLSKLTAILDRWVHRLMRFQDLRHNRCPLQRSLNHCGSY